jgi:hypothetical protein
MIMSSYWVMFHGFLMIIYAETIVTYELLAKVSELAGFSLLLSLK